MSKSELYKLCSEIEDTVFHKDLAFQCHTALHNMAYRFGEHIILVPKYTGLFSYKHYEIEFEKQTVCDIYKNRIIFNPVFDNDIGMNIVARFFALYDRYKRDKKAKVETDLKQALKNASAYATLNK